MFTDAAAAAFDTLAALPLVLTDAAATTVFARAEMSLVLADAAATTLFTFAPHPLVLADAAATTVFARAPLPLVLAKFVLASVTPDFQRVSLLLDSLCMRCLFVDLSVSLESLSHTSSDVK